jgi:hypothetical protein
VPTAHTSVLEAALTPHSLVLLPSCGTAVGDQAVPFQCSAIGCDPPPLGGET